MGKATRKGAADPVRRLAGRAPSRRPQTRPKEARPPTLGGPTLAGGVQIAGPQARPARRPGDPGPRLGARGAPAARGGRGGYAHPLPRAAPAGQRVGPRGQNTATTLRGRFLPPSTYAGEDLGAAAPEKRQGREAPAGLGLAFLTGGASARTAAPQGPAGALSAGAGLRGRRTAAARRAAAEAATTAGAGRAAPRMVARATDFSPSAPSRQ